MAVMIPDVDVRNSSAETGERLVFEALRRGLDERYRVYHHVCFLDRDERRKGTLREGEVDFLIFHPEQGLLIVEVKGGGISHERGQWFTHNPRGTVQLKQSPLEQARKGMHHFHSRIARTFPGLEYTRGYAIWFPQCVFDQSVPATADSDPRIIWDANDLEAAADGRLQQRVEHAFRAWSRGKRLSPNEAAGIRKKVLEPEFRLVRSLTGEKQELDQHLMQLTEQQYGLLSFLENQTRACIEGPAGAGKTLLAMEKCRRLAAAGKRTLFLCYTKRLAEFLTQTMGSDQVQVDHFHHFVEKLCQQTGVPFEVPGDPKDQGVFYLSTCADLLVEALGETEQRFDALVVDEGQDFEEIWWVPLEMLLRDEQSALYIFYDGNQNLFKRHYEFPVKTPPYMLTENCRNTRAINAWIRQHFPYKAPSKPGAPEGTPPVMHAWSRPAEQKKQLEKTLGQLLRAGYGLEDIVVLTPFRVQNSFISRLRDEPPYQDLAMHTIMSFKGLEANVVLLCDVGGHEFSRRRDLIYTAVSRAKMELHIFHDKGFTFWSTDSAD